MIMKKREIARFCAQLEILLSAGIPLLEALSLVKDILKGKQYGEIIQKVSDGESLAVAMKKYFPPMVISSIESAERVGNLEEVLKRLLKYYDERAEVEDKIKSSLIYPTFVILLCILSLFIMFVFVLPGFKGLFVDLGAELPLLSRIIINTGEYVSMVWYIPILIILFLSIFIINYRKSKRGALIVDGWILKIRVFSREQIIHSFCSLGSLLCGGISIMEALGSTAGSLNNKAYQEIVYKIKDEVEDGERLSSAIAKHKIFPKNAIQMLKVGENSGKLGEMLINISSFYEKEKELFIKRFTAMLEPMLTLFVGIVVGVIAISMFLPMITMISKLQ
jgi:type II secretory pathway component PulF